MRRGGRRGGRSRAEPGAEGRAERPAVAPPGWGLRPAPRGGAQLPPLWVPRGAGGSADPPHCAPSQLGSASREELGSACTAASWILLFLAFFWVFHITFKGGNAKTMCSFHSCERPLYLQPQTQAKQKNSLLHGLGNQGVAKGDKGVTEETVSPPGPSELPLAPQFTLSQLRFAPP